MIRMCDSNSIFPKMIDQNQIRCEGILKIYIRLPLFMFQLFKLLKLFKLSLTFHETIDR